VTLTTPTFPTFPAAFHTLNVANISPETLTGTAAADTLTGGSDAELIFGLDGNDTLSGDVGGDTLTGGLGKDSMTGGLGADSFDCNLKTETKKGLANRDVITDFSGVGGDGDHIDLSGIDANSTKHGNQDFKFIGSKAFHDKAGELHVLHKTDFFLVEGDINGDGRADFQIEVHSGAALSRSDFLGVIIPLAHQATHHQDSTPDDLGWFWGGRG